MPSTRLSTGLILLIVGALALSACGRRAPLVRPADVTPAQSGPGDVSAPTNLPVPEYGGANVAAQPDETEARPPSERRFILDGLVE